MHKDHQIVTFITFIIIALIFKLAILIALHQIYYVQSTQSQNDLNCQVLIYLHIPQVFLASALLVLVIKSIMITVLQKENDHEFKDRQKYRVKKQFWIIVMVQTVTYFLLFTRYLQTCKIVPSGKEDDFFIFSYDYIVYTCLKIIYIGVLIGLLGKIAFTSQLFNLYKKGLLAASVVMVLTIVKEVVGLVFFIDT